MLKFGKSPKSNDLYFYIINIFVIKFGSNCTMTVREVYFKILPPVGPHVNEKEKKFTVLKLKHWKKKKKDWRNGQWLSSHKIWRNNAAVFEKPEFTEGRTCWRIRYIPYLYILEVWQEHSRGGGIIINLNWWEEFLTILSSLASLSLLLVIHSIAKACGVSGR